MLSLFKPASGIFLPFGGGISGLIRRTLPPLPKKFTTFSLKWIPLSENPLQFQFF